MSAPLFILAAAGSTATTPAAVGDLVHRAGYRRLWRITSHIGQLVHLTAGDTPPAGHEAPTVIEHAGDLVLAGRAQCPGCGTTAGPQSACPGCGELP